MDSECYFEAPQEYIDFLGNEEFEYFTGDADETGEWLDREFMEMMEEMRE